MTEQYAVMNFTCSLCTEGKVPRIAHSQEEEKAIQGEKKGIHEEDAIREDEMAIRGRKRTR